MNHFFSLISMTPLFAQNYESWGVKSILIGGIISLATAVGYLYISKEKAIARKDEAILKAIDDHMVDLKDNVGDMKAYVENYQKFTDRLIRILNSNKDVSKE